MLPELTEWGSPTIFTQIGGACVPSVITFGVGIIMLDVFQCWLKKVYITFT